MDEDDVAEPPLFTGFRAPNQRSSPFETCPDDRQARSAQTESWKVRYAGGLQSSSEAQMEQLPPCR